VEWVDTYALDNMVLVNGSKKEHQQARLNTHKTKNNNHTIDKVIYVETQYRKKPQQ
jgi:hypothetical protein